MVKPNYSYESHRNLYRDAHGDKTDRHAKGYQLGLQKPCNYVSFREYALSQSQVWSVTDAHDNPPRYGRKMSGGREPLYPQTNNYSYQTSMRSR